MGVQLNIKDERTVALARELSRDLGKSITEVVRDALEEKRGRRDADVARTIREVRALTAGLRERWPVETRQLTGQEMMDAIYDEDGLPI